MLNYNCIGHIETAAQYENQAPALDPSLSTTKQQKNLLPYNGQQTQPSLYVYRGLHECSCFGATIEYVRHFSDPFFHVARLNMT